MASASPGSQGAGQTSGPSKIKITFLASEWGSSNGGLSTINRELAIQLAKCPDVDITFFVPKCSEDDKNEAHSHNVRILKATRRPGFEELEWLSFPPEDLQIDVIVGHGVKLGRQAQSIRRTHKFKWVQVVHTDPEELGMFKSYANAISMGAEKHNVEVELCEMADFVVGVGPKLSEAFRSYLRGCQKDQTIFNFTPGVFDEFTSVKQVVEERKHCSVLVFGRGDTEDFELKGFDIAGRAVSVLPDTHLVFVGAPDGKHEEIAQRFLQCDLPTNRLRVRSYVESRESLKRLFCEVDLVLMPSRTEGFGLTALEALSAGLPVLVSKNSGFGEALSELPFGSSFVIDSGDPKVWAAAIKKIWDKDRQSRLGEADLLRTSYEKKYSWTKQSYDLLANIRDLPCGRLQLHTDCQAIARDGTNEGASRALPDQQEPEAVAQEVGVAPITSSQSNEVHLHIRIDCETITGLDTQQEARSSLRTLHEPHTVALGAATEAQVALLPTNFGNRIIPSADEILRSIAGNYLQDVKPSNQEEYNGFLQYLQEVRKVLVVETKTGSLIITVECTSLLILDELWEDYYTGYLNEMAQKYLVTEDVLKELSLIELKLVTTIVEKEYRSHREHFLYLSTFCPQKKTTESSSMSSTQIEGNTPAASFEIFIEVSKLPDVLYYFALVVDADDTIRKVKMKIKDKLGIPYASQILKLDLKELEDTCSLSDYKIRSECRLWLNLTDWKEYKFEVGVRMWTGKLTILHVNPFDSIERVKTKIQLTEGIPTDQQRLCFANKVLEDDGTLNGYRIYHKSILHLAVEIFVKTLSRKMILLDVLPSDTIGIVKKKLEKLEGYSPEKTPNLAHDGRQLNSDATLAQHNIQMRSILHEVDSNTKGVEEPSPKHGLPHFSFSVCLKIAANVLKAGEKAFKVFEAFVHSQKEQVKKAVRSALEAPGIYVDGITEGSILVNLRCSSKQRFLEFLLWLRKKEVKKRLESQLKCIGFKEEVEVTITNRDEVDEKFDEIRTSRYTTEQEQKLVKELVDLDLPSQQMKIYVEMSSGRKITFELKPSDVVKMLKEKLEVAEGIPSDKQLLEFGSHKLEDNHRLSFYNIQDKSTIQLIERGMKIFVTAKIDENSKTLTLYVFPFDTISFVKLKIQEKIGVLPKFQRLSYSDSNDLKDDLTLREYKIENHSKLRLL